MKSPKESHSLKRSESFGLFSGSSLFIVLSTSTVMSGRVSKDEMVTVDTPVPLTGTWEIEIKGVEILKSLLSLYLVSQRYF